MRPLQGRFGAPGYVRVSLWLKREDHDRLKRVARKRKITAEVLYLDIVEEYLARLGNKDP
jgi:hypothetical protein